MLINKTFAGSIPKNVPSADFGTRLKLQPITNALEIFRSMNGR